MAFFGYFNVLVVILTLVVYVNALLKPVAIVHGIMFNPDDHMEKLRDEIVKVHPGTEVNLIEILYNQESFLPMWYQVSRFHERIEKMVHKYPDGINLIGYSQGGLIARGVIETMPDHNIETFVSLSSPQFGFHGEYYVPKSKYYIGNEEKFSDSVAGFWKDPKDMDKYRREDRFLVTLNNEVRHELNQQFKDSMCKLKKLVLIGGKDDGIVVPWQSALFGYDDEFGRIIEMQGHEIYMNDLFCLRTLDQRQAIVKYSIPGVQHADWFNNITVIHKHIIPHLVVSEKPYPTSLSPRMLNVFFDNNYHGLLYLCVVIVVSNLISRV